MKALVRSLFLLLLAVAFLAIMQRLGLLRWSDIVAAFAAHPKTIVGVCLTQAFCAVIMMIRYWKLLNLFGVNTPLVQASAATFVSTALGQWFPGSLAVVEVLRIGLMFGNDPQRPLESTGSGAGLKAKLAIVSLVDRLVGFLGILLMGFVFSGYLLSQVISTGGSELTGVVFLMVTSGLGALALAALPLLVRWKAVRLFCRKWLDRPRAPEQRAGRLFFAVLRQLEPLRHDIEAGTRHPSRLFWPILLSIANLLAASAVLYLAARALSVHLDFFQIVCVFPIISVASLLPLGFAGIGGYQLIMATVFGIFAVSPSVVASAGVLQSALGLFINTVLGLLFLRVSAGQLRSVFSRPAAPQVS
ncbi:MAG: flippase-like domain-containing protein [Betaproteobacteria bacterium]|nr:flippase-like domain-containing protein [Betaproteobacteria bacterium]